MTINTYLDEFDVAAKKNKNDDNLQYIYFQKRNKIIFALEPCAHFIFTFFRVRAQ